MKKTLFILAALFIQLSVFAQASSNPNDQVIEGEIIVQLKETYTAEAFLKHVEDYYEDNIQLEHIRKIAPTANIHLFSFEEDLINGDKLIEELRHHPQIKTLQRNYRVEYRETEPDDAEFDLQWGLRKIQMPEAWDFTTGGVSAIGDTIVVAILDSGYELTHEDLQGNIWYNKYELPNDGIDNDNNGYIDDINGYDFDEASGTLKVHHHGHSVAGVIGAKGNNEIGITGINWNVKMMLLNGRRVDSIIEAYEYVVEMRRRYNESNGEEGAFVVVTNASFGIDRTFCTEQETWGAMYDRLGEVGILTAAATDNSSYDVDELGDMPTTCPSDYIITVLNTNIQDEKHSGSAYGKVNIDMGVPGENSYSIKLNNAYGEFGGNSAAAPHLTGAIALLYSLPCEELGQISISNPAGTALQIREVLLKGVDSLNSLSDLTATGGRLNVFNSMLLLQEFCGGTMGDLDFLAITPNPTHDILNVKYETPDFEPYSLRVFNAIGQLMYKKTIQPDRFGSKSFQFDVSAWAAGVYLVTLENGGEMISEKFLKY